MDLGSFLELDDDLFSEARDRSQPREDTVYQAKTCEPEWFEKVREIDDGEEMQIHKYSADYAFRCRKYTKALEHYKETIELLSPTNLTMLRDVLESVCRCHLARGSSQDAIQHAIRLVNTAQNFDQKTTSLNLLSEVYKATGDLDLERLTLLKCIWLHPMNCDAWLRLTYVYLSLFKDSEKRCNHDENLLAQKGFGMDGDISENKSNNHVESSILNSQTSKSDFDHIKNTENSSNFKLLDQNQRIVVGTCLLRTKILAQHVGHLPLFVKKRYRHIMADMDAALTDLGYGESFMNERKAMLEADISADKSSESPSANIPESEVIKKIEEDDFQALFCLRWFPESL